MKRFVILFLVALFIISVPVDVFAAGNSAEDMYEEGMQYYEKADYDRAFARFQISGEVKGYAPSLNMLGVCYRDGLGTEPDLKEAERLFSLSSDRGYAPAAESLAELQTAIVSEEAQPASLGQRKNEAPVLLSAKPEDNNCVRVVWQREEGAEGYTVFRRAYLGTFSKVITTRETSFLDQTCENGIQYYYKIRAKYSDGSWSKDSNQIGVTVPEPLDSEKLIPRIASLSLDKGGMPTLEWEKVDGAVVYQILRSEEKDSGFTHLKTTKQTSLTSVSEKRGHTYYYKIRAQLSDYSWGAFSETVGITVPKWKLSVGDTITIGLWKQNNETPGNESIAWQVLAVEEEKALVISEQGLDCCPYHNDRHESTVTWDNSSIRFWLNDYFYNNAFSDEEKTRIIMTDIKAGGNPSFSTEYGNETKDRVFLLSADEANKYFSSSQARQCSATDYAKSRGGYTDESSYARCWWWLRTPGDSQADTAYVDIGGNINLSGTDAVYAHNVIRPAIWIEMKEDEEDPGEKESEGQPEERLILYYRAGGDSKGDEVLLPEITSAVLQSGEKLVIEWSEITEPLMYYKVFRSSDGKKYTTRGVSQTNVFSDSSISSGTTYYYKILAVYSNGSKGEYSNAIRITIP